MFKIIFIGFSLLFFCGCMGQKKPTTIPGELPMAVSNNAIAYLNIDHVDQYYTFNGLQTGKTFKDITNKAFVWQQGSWHLMAVPDGQLPVLASVAVSVKDSVYLFGGYTVAADHSEKSIPNVWLIDGHDILKNPQSSWQPMPPMPTPVDDTVALVYLDRYIYLISGWHDVDNVDLVQVFDTHTHQWKLASHFPLPPVFGHAGGMVDDTMVICDGVKVEKIAEKKEFLPSPECVIGEINPNDITSIRWTQIDHHSGEAFYRMAASAGNNSQVSFIAGSNNPYNFNGIGYNTTPSKPSGDVRIFDVKQRQWLVLEDVVEPTMDHRALLKTPNGMVIMGGMGSDQKVIDKILIYEPNQDLWHK